MDDDDKTGSLFVSGPAQQHQQQQIQQPSLQALQMSSATPDGTAPIKMESSSGSAQQQATSVPPPGQALSTALMVNQMLAVQQHQHSETMSSLTSVLQDKDERIRDLEGSLGSVQEKLESLTSTMESQQKLVCFFTCLKNEGPVMMHSHAWNCQSFETFVIIDGNPSRSLQADPRHDWPADDSQERVYSQRAGAHCSGGEL